MSNSLQFHNEIIPLWHQGQLAFGEAAAPILSPNPIPLDVNEREMEEETISRHRLPALSNQLVLDAKCDKKMFSRSESLILTFSNSIQIKLEPVGSDFLDIAFHLQGMDIDYRPKNGTYADSTLIMRLAQRGPAKLDRLSFNFILQSDLFRMLTVKDCQICIGSDSQNLSDMGRTSDVVVTGLLLDGELDFSRRSDWSYNHSEKLRISIYPDRMYNYIQGGRKSTDGSYRVKMSMR